MKEIVVEISRPRMDFQACVIMDECGSVKRGKNLLRRGIRLIESARRSARFQIENMNLLEKVPIRFVYSRDLLIEAERLGVKLDE